MARFHHYSLHFQITYKYVEQCALKVDSTLYPEENQEGERNGHQIAIVIKEDLVGAKQDSKRNVEPGYL